MTIRFCLTSGLYDCALHITDAQGTREFYIYLPGEETEEDAQLAIDIYGDSFDLSVTPMIPNYQGVLGEIPTETWKEKFAMKAASKVLDAFAQILLRVGCKYHLSGISDGSTVTISMAGYTCDLWDRFDLFELEPVMYMFFEVLATGQRIEPVQVWAVNRNEVLKIAKKLILCNWGLHLIISYPLRMRRVKHLSKDKYIYKTLLAFHRMSPEKRQKILDRMEK